MKLEFREGEVAAPPSRTKHNENVMRLEFDLPNKLLGQVVAAGAAYLVLMYLAFRGGNGLTLIFMVFGLVLVAYYGLPLAMQRASGRREDNASRRGAWGIDTGSGYLSGRAAYAQIMTVPLLMVAWALLVRFIA